MESIERRYRPRLFQALKMHLIVTVLGVLLVVLMILFRGMYAAVLEDPLAVGLALLGVCLIVGAVVLAVDIVRFKKHSPREIGLTEEVLQVELPNGRRLETKWANIQSGATRHLIWMIVTSDETIAFSIAGLTYREQGELGQAIADMVARSAAGHGRASYKGALDRLDAWGDLVWAARSKKAAGRLADKLLETIAEDEVPDRPGRREPRVNKRRPKPYQNLTRPRREMREIPHRSKYKKKAA